MATDTQDIDKLFAEADGAGSTPTTNGEDINSLDSLKAKAAAKAAKGKAAGASAPVADASSSTAPTAESPQTAAALPDGVKQKPARKGGKGGASASTAGTFTEASDADTPTDQGNGLSGQANDTLAQMAAKNGETTSTAEVPVSESDGIPSEVPGLTQGEGGNLYEQRKAELDAARKRGGGRGSKKLSAAEIRRREQERARAAKEKEKAKAKEKTEKQKAAEAKRKADAKAKQEERKKKEDERKKRLAAEKAQRAAQRASKATPDLLKKEPKAVQELFAAHYATALAEKVRRPKCDRGDFAAGWMTLLRAFRKDNKGTTIPTAPAPAAAS